MLSGRSAVFSLMVLLAGCVADGTATQGSEISAQGSVPAAEVDQPANLQAGTQATADDSTQLVLAETDAGRPKPASPTATKMIIGVPVKLKPAGRIAGDPTALSRGRFVFRCVDGGSLTVDYKGSTVDMVDPDGEMINLPASPPGQASRFARKPYALVLDGGDALFTKPRKPPFDCRR